MQFPVYFNIAGHKLHAHLAMELLAYTGGFQIYLWLRRKQRNVHPPLPFEQNMWILVGCVFGALLGSKLLAFAESWPEYWSHRNDLTTLLGGKTIVGGLLGGWLGVEIAKHFLHLKKSTGDLFVFPLIFGMAVGRVGCFLTGLPDHTYGTPTTLPWAINFGDSIPRHPTQIYEILFLISWGIVLAIIQRRVRFSGPVTFFAHKRKNNRSAKADPTQDRNGPIFRLFMLGYLAMRFAIEFIKPTWKPYLGFSAIQLACLAGVIVSTTQLLHLRKNPSPAFEIQAGTSP